METIVINLGGTDYSIQYYFDIDKELIIDSIQDLDGFEWSNLMHIDIIEEIEEKILKYYGRD